MHDNAHFWEGDILTIFLERTETLSVLCSTGKANNFHYIIPLILSPTEPPLISYQGRF